MKKQRKKGEAQHSMDEYLGPFIRCSRRNRQDRAWLRRLGDHHPRAGVGLPAVVALAVEQMIGIRPELLVTSERAGVGEARLRFIALIASNMRLHAVSDDVVSFCRGLWQHGFPRVTQLGQDLRLL